jgi:hypothetical protein
MCYATKTLTLTWGLNQNAENAIAHVWPITIMNAWASYRNGGTLNFVHVLRLSISPYETTLTGPERSVAAMELAVPRLRFPCPSLHASRLRQCICVIEGRREVGRRAFQRTGFPKDSELHDIHGPKVFPLPL